MGALKNLWNSERGLVAIVLIIACTVLAMTSRITVEQWTSYTEWIFGMYAAAKTITGTAAIIKTPTPGADADPLGLGAILSSLMKSGIVPQAPPVPSPAPVIASTDAAVPAPKEPS